MNEDNTYRISLQNKRKEPSRSGLPDKNASEDNEYVEQFLIEIERPGEKLDMQMISKLLERTGIKLDSNYGPFCVNPKAGRYVVRGVASLEAKEKLELIPGIKLFRDTNVYPT